MSHKATLNQEMMIIPREKDFFCKNNYHIYFLYVSWLSGLKEILQYQKKLNDKLESNAINHYKYQCVL